MNNRPKREIRNTRRGSDQVLVHARLCRRAFRGKDFPRTEPRLKPVKFSTGIINSQFTKLERERERWRYKDMYVVSTCTNIVINMCMSVRAVSCVTGATLYNCPTNDRVCVWFLNEFVILSCVCLLHLPI